MKSFVLLFLAFALFALSIANWISAQHLWLWMTSILTKEFGHWLALLSFLILILVGLRLTKKLDAKSFKANAVAVALLIVAMLGFLNPLYTALKFEPEWTGALGAGTPTLLNFKILWLGRHEKKISYRTLPYSRPDGQNLTLDYYPAQGQANKAWILIVHGGGWDAGDSQQLPELNSHLANLGYAVFAINYRLAPRYKWPDVKKDVTASVNFIRGHASEFKIDPLKYAVLGRSAGAQIAGAFAYSQKEKSPKALLLFYAPTDLTFGYEAGDEDDILASRSLIRNYMGSAPLQNKAEFADASVIEHVKDKPVPTLLLHGHEDNLVWYKHSERLYARLQDAKVPSVYILMPWATHGFDYSLDGPAGQISTKATEQFLKVWLLK